MISFFLGCSTFLGTYYLEEKKYEKGIQSLERRVAENPSDAEAQYYLGRLYLAQEKPDKALTPLSNAARLSPKDAKTHFWLGVAKWAVGDFEGERQSYLKALALDPSNLPARLYLGHNLLDKGDGKGALSAYEQVLKMDPQNPEALYNRGLALQMLKKSDQAKSAWNAYLQAYSQGRWALRAADSLNALGDFSYRNYMIGYRRVTLRKISFVPDTARLTNEAKVSLDVIGSILTINQNIHLKIMAYVKGNTKLANARADSIKRYLVTNYPNIDQMRLAIKGLGRSAKVSAKGQAYQLSEYVAFKTVKT